MSLWSSYTGNNRGGSKKLVSVADLHWGGIKIIKCNKESIIKLDVKISSHTDNPQGLGASEKKRKKILYNTTRGRTHLLP